jgi:hypothetical protein
VDGLKVAEAELTSVLSDDPAAPADD